MGEVVMPRLSDSMEEGVILKWLRSNGDQIKRGEPLVEIETDKANMTYEADQDGALPILVDEGATLPIGTPIATIGESALEQPSEEPQDQADAAQEADTAQEQPSSVGNGKPQPQVSASTTEQPQTEEGSSQRIKASPVARRIAQELKVDLKSVNGTGPDGRIVKNDVLTYADQQPKEAAPATQETAPLPAEETPAVQESTTPTAQSPSLEGLERAKGEVTTVEPTRTQTTIARRMAESRATIPDFSVSAEIDMERAVELREQLADPSADIKPPSLNDLIVKACALALREFPNVNASYSDAKFERYSRINIGIAVATDEALLVPTIFDADHLSLHEIADESRRLAGRARSGEITPPELSGGTFTVSNLGMFGVDEFDAVINQRQAAILTVGAVKQRPVVIDGEIVPRHTTRLKLSCDHRILYGADAAKFLARLRELLEHPAALT